jgi:hypothetical protein
MLWADGLSRPLIGSGTLVVGAVWAVAALVLPWTRSRRWPALEAVRVVLWAVGLGVGTAAAAHLGGQTPAGTALVGAFVGGVVAFVTRGLARRVRGQRISGESRSTRVPST